MLRLILAVFTWLTMSTATQAFEMSSLIETGERFAI